MHIRVHVCAHTGTCVCVHAKGRREADVFGNHPRKKNLELAARMVRSKKLSSETHLTFCRVNLTRQLLVNLAASMHMYIHIRGQGPREMAREVE